MRLHFNHQMRRAWYYRMNQVCCQPSLLSSDEASQTSLITSDEPSLLPADETSVIPSDEPALLPSDEASLQPSDETSLLPADESSRRIKKINKEKGEASHRG